MNNNKVLRSYVERFDCGFVGWNLAFKYEFDLGGDVEFSLDELLNLLNCCGGIHINAENFPCDCSKRDQNH